MGRRPAEMLGVAELACQIFLKEIVIGSVRHTSEKLSQRRLEGLAFGPSIGSIIVALTGQQRASVWIECRIPGRLHVSGFMNGSVILQDATCSETQFFGWEHSLFKPQASWLPAIPNCLFPEPEFRWDDGLSDESVLSEVSNALRICHNEKYTERPIVLGSRLSNLLQEREEVSRRCNVEVCIKSSRRPLGRKCPLQEAYSGLTSRHWSRESSSHLRHPSNSCSQAVKLFQANGRSR